MPIAVGFGRDGPDLTDDADEHKRPLASSTQREIGSLFCFFWFRPQSSTGSGPPSARRLSMAMQPTFTGKHRTQQS